MPILGILASAISGNIAPIPPYLAYESIATVSVGGGGQADITFSSIPSGFKHLQIRGIARTNRALTRDALKITVNGNTSDYAYHNLYGNGTSPTGAGLASQIDIVFNDIAGNTATASVFGAMVIDILDYALTTKIKNIRGLGGSDNNGSGIVGLNSGAYYGNTNALTSIKLESYGGTAFVQYSQFALYGIK
jgi:hypothetical protein